jgi:single-stranded DNA-binding protein
MSTTNNVEISGIVKWDPNVFPPKSEDQKPIMVFAVEFKREKSNRSSVFHVKSYGDLTQTLQSKGLTQGDQVVVTGSLNEAKWKDRNTDEWKSRVEVWAHNVDFVSRAGNDTSARAVDSYEDIPF